MVGRGGVSIKSRSALPRKSVAIMLRLSSILEELSSEAFPEKARVGLDCVTNLPLKFYQDDTRGTANKAILCRAWERRS